VLVERYWRSDERLLGVTADIADEREAARTMRAAGERFGRLDTCKRCRCAGTRRARNRGNTRALQRVLDVNLLGMVACCKHAIPEMVGAGGGSITNVSSVNAEVARTGWPPTSRLCPRSYFPHTRRNGLNRNVSSARRDRSAVVHCFARRFTPVAMRMSASTRLRRSNLFDRVLTDVHPQDTFRLSR
jgi:NAD(P)-dependent dehydrogenase (short-subunit alcohol dehydrogenase family)